MEDIEKEPLQLPPHTPPSTRISSPKAHDTPMKPNEASSCKTMASRSLNKMKTFEECGLNKEDAFCLPIASPTPDAMPSLEEIVDGVQDNTVDNLKAPTPTTSIPGSMMVKTYLTSEEQQTQRTSPCFFTRVGGDSGLNLLAEAAKADATNFNTLVKAAATNLVTTFSDQREAMRYCLMKATDDTQRIGIRKRKADNADEDILYDVYSTLPAKNFRREDFPESFDMIKAYAPSIVAKYAGKSPFLMYDMNTPGIEHTVHKKGTIRETFVLPDKKKLRLYHHTCSYLDDPKPCVNCQNPEHHARCLAGEEFYAIMDK